MKMDSDNAWGVLLGIFMLISSLIVVQTFPFAIYGIFTSILCIVVCIFVQPDEEVTQNDKNRNQRTHTIHLDTGQNP